MRTALSLAILLAILLTTSVPATGQLTVSNVVLVQAGVQYVMIILMENHPLNYSTNPNGIIGNPSAPFINSLAKNYSLTTDYFALNDGSLPNYIALTDANVSSVNGGCMAPGPGCSTDAVNIVDRIEASGRTWKAYMEDYSGGCNGTASPLYAAFHNPFVFYSDITGNSARCTRIVSANPGHSGPPDNQLITDLGSTATASNYIWLTPNECDNMHDTGSGACSTNLVANGDNYLSQLVPKILNSTVFRSQRAALFITFDEPTFCSSTPAYSQCPVPGIWAGPAVKHGFASSVHYDHYSLLSTIENLWRLMALTPNDASAPAMGEFFR